jgi:7 transmembrane receptor (Secretin family)
MFIYYYGKSPRRESSLIVIGACFSVAAQILTVIIVSNRERKRTLTNAFFPITLNFLVILLLSNLLFIIGVNSNKSAIRCEIIALLLHYLLLTTAFWCFVFIALIYELITNEHLRMKRVLIFVLTYSCPAVYVVVSPIF